MFRVDYVLEQAGNKEFGTVFINEKENVALTLAAAGLARVRPPSDKQSPYYEQLSKAAEDAEAKSLGLHTKDKDAAAAAVRDLPSPDGECVLEKGVAPGSPLVRQGGGEVAGAGVGGWRWLAASPSWACTPCA